MCSISSSSTFSSSISLNMFNSKVLKVFSICVGFEVVDQSEHGLHGLFGPSSEGLAELSSLTGSADASEVGGVGDAASVGEDILEILFGLGDSQSLDGFGSLVGILVMNSEISS